MSTTTLPIPEKLDATKPQKVSFCIPNWLRDIQVAQNIKRPGIGRISEVHGLQDEPAAIVCYGPSLNQTWEQVRQFKNIFTCSGAHRFLIDRGIIPRWDVEVDPREHKALLIGEPHPDVEYLIASACHPKLLDHLEGFNVKLWHVFEPNEEIPMLPRGEWMITGGCGAGLRAMTIARWFGYRELHIFGMDGCDGPTGKHAGAHPMQARDSYPVDYNGKTYYTTPAFLEAARGTFHELNVLKDVNATFYGDGLVQAMAKDYKRKPIADSFFIAFNKPELISPEFRDLNARLHQEKPEFGVGGDKYAPMITSLRAKTGCDSVLDYGCGKSLLAKALKFPIWEYDPAIPGKEALPRAADLVVCTDVLEHIEPERLDFVLKDIQRCTRKLAYVVVATGPARKSYADGRNTHLIQQPRQWWESRLSKFFSIGKIFERASDLQIILLPLGSVKRQAVRVPEGFDKLSHRLVLEDWIHLNHWTRGAEVGVFKGNTYFHLLEKCPDLKLYGVDLWEAQPEKDVQFDLGGRSYKFDELPKWYERIQKQAKPYGDRAILIKSPSAEAASQVADGSLDFVFIDADHLEEGVRADILAWRPKVRPGGTLAGHDIHMPGVRAAVDDLCPGWQEFKQSVWGIVL